MMTMMINLQNPKAMLAKVKVKAKAKMVNQAKKNSQKTKKNDCL